MLRAIWLGAVALVLCSATLAFDYDEAVHGPLSDDSANPTVLAPVVLGSNTLAGSVIFGSSPNDYVTFTVPTGSVLGAIVVTDLDPSADFWFEIRNQPIGGVLYSGETDQTNLGLNLLPVMGLAPLQAGPYWVTFGIDDANEQDYALTFETSRMILYVDADATGANDGSSWCNAYNYLQDALAAAGSLTEIRVAQGTYKPDRNSATPGGTGDRAATFAIAGNLSLRGSYAGCGATDPDSRDFALYDTTLSGDLDGDDGPDYLNNEENSIHVVTGIGSGATSILDGFTVIGGNADAPPWEPGSSGGGLYFDAADTSIMNCVVVGNWANHWGGGLYYFAGNLTFDHCTFIGNTGNFGGGGVASYHSSADPIAMNCNFLGNNSPYGAGWLNGENNDTLIMNSLFVGNQADHGAAINFGDDSSRLTAINCTVVENSASFTVGGVQLNQGALINLLAWGNTDSTGSGESAQFNDSEGTTDYSCIQGWTGSLGGVGNHGDPPSFVGGPSGTWTANATPAARPGQTQLYDTNAAYGANELVGKILNPDTSQPLQTLIVSNTATEITVWGDFVTLGTTGATYQINDYHLQPDSSCIDAADNSSVPPDSLDLDQDGDTTEPVPVDLDGEPRFSDDPSTADTGNGVPPVVDMGAYEYPPVIYVDDDATGANDGSSWCDAYLYLQDALGVAAGSGGTLNEILVAQGVYKADQGVSQTPGDREATFQLLNGVTIKGGYAGCGEADPDAHDISLYETILSGDLDGNDVGDPWDPSRGENSYHILTGSGIDETALLDGFTITAGYASSDWPHYCGGGMYNSNSSPTVINCAFVGNQGGDGGGMCNVNNSDPSLYNCAFVDNDAYGSNGGGIYNADSSPVLEGCIFDGNRGDDFGGGMYNTNSSPTLIGCVFTHNFADPSGGGGMFSRNGSQPTVMNCLFLGNNQGGFVTESDEPTLVNSTFVGNDRGVIVWGGNPSLTNCVFWANGNGEGASEQIVGTAMVTYSLVQGGWPGAGNIDSDPLFVNPGYWDDNGTPENWDDFFVVGDYHLESGSPCIDSGDNDAVPPDTLDIDNDTNTTEPVPLDLAGNPRFIDDPAITDTGNGTAPIVDMGSYEFQSISSDPLIGDRVWMDLDGDGIQDGGEPGMASALVYLYDGGGLFLDFTFTDVDGYYSFANVMWMSEYALRFVPSPGYHLSDPDQGVDDEKDSDANPATGYSPVFELFSLDDETRWDAGMVPLLPCIAPDEPIYLYAMTLDANLHPVLHYMDSNQPSQVTGYNVYRSANAFIPKPDWPQVASDVIDMDEATPNKQWVDISDQEPPPPGNVWYYQLTAYNGPPCDEEGPFGWPQERDCDNGLDDDLDTLYDCDDPDCYRACDPLPIALGDSWNYFKGYQEPTTYDPAVAEWAQPGFDDSSWPAGPSGFGYGTDCASLHGTLLDDMQHNYVSFYARIPFRVEDPTLVSTLTLTMDYDDGWVAYLNGVEVARSAGMGGTPGQPPTHDQTTQIGDHECSGSPGSANPPEEIDLGGSIGLLVPGTNMLALQGHNRALISSDFSLIPMLTHTE